MLSVALLGPARCVTACLAWTMYVKVGMVSLVVTTLTVTLNDFDVKATPPSPGFGGLQHIKRAMYVLTNANNPLLTFICSSPTTSYRVPQTFSSCNCRPVIPTGTSTMATHAAKKILTSTVEVERKFVPTILFRKHAAQSSDKPSFTLGLIETRDTFNRQSRLRITDKYFDDP